ncbi:pentatricopeptide (PPR) repeat-containing protein [Striga asiatica]|uniref:Pentatricopeptide (PPR) repeat-containing protein n=1 Tax=Striga asiatica TaxID=4170 RepID=A0A5A7QW44_STRAF|nr:pentatricopeptide (PPR) repeat-containing protein [Striga asiatica]
MLAPIIKRLSKVWEPKTSSCFTPRRRVDDFSSVNVDVLIRYHRELVALGPSVVAMTKLLNAVVRKKHYSDALLLFDEMRLRKVPVDEYTMNIAIRCFCLLSRPELGLAVLGSFFKLSLKPSLVTFNTLLRGLFSNGKALEAEELLSNSLTLKTFEPNEVTAVTVAEGLSGTRAAASLDLLELTGGLKPNGFAYSAVVAGLMKDGMADDALQVLFKVTEKGVSATAVVYASMFRTLCDAGRWRDVKTLIRKMAEHNICFDGTSRSVLMAAFSQKGMVEEAEGVLEIMAQINDACLLDHMDKPGGALSFLSAMEGKGVNPDEVTYGIVAVQKRAARTFLNKLPGEQSLCSERWRGKADRLMTW